MSDYQDKPPRIVAAFSVPPREVYRGELRYFGPPEPDILVGIAVGEDGSAYSIILDDGSPETLMHDYTVADVGDNIYERQRRDAA